MISKLGKIALAVTLGLGAIVSTALPVDAMPSVAGPSVNRDNLVPVQFYPRHRLGNSGWSQDRYGPRCQTPSGNCRHYYRGYYYQTPWWTLPLIIGGAVASQNHYGNSHVQWCLSRYRSYDPRSNTYLGNDGRRHVCR